MAHQRENGSLKKMNFYIEIEGVQGTGFKTCSALKESWSTISERNGNEANQDRKQRGKMTIDAVTLTQGVTSQSNELAEWNKAGDRRSVSFVQMNHEQEEAKRINAYEAFISEFIYADGYDASSEGDVQIRSITIEMESIEEM